MEHERHDLSELEQLFRQGQFGRLGEDDLLRCAEFRPEFAKDGTDAHVGILKVRCGVALEAEHFRPREDIVGHAMLGEFGVFDRTESDNACDVILFIARKFGILLLDHGAGAGHGFPDKIAQRDIVAGARLHQFVVLAENAAESDMVESGGDAHAFGSGENLLEVELLRRARHIPDGVRVPAFDTVFDRGQVGRGIEEAAVALADEARLVGQRGNIGKKDASGAFADLRGAVGEKFVDQCGQCRIVEAFAESLVEADAELFVDVGKLRPGKIDQLLPDGAVFRVALLEFDQFFARGLVHGGIGLFECVDLAVKTRHLRDGIALQRGAVEEMLPAVEHLAELRAPIAEMVVGHDFVSDEPRDAGQRVAEDGAADVSDVHRLGDVGRTEIDDHALRVPCFRGAATRIASEGAQLLRDPLRLEAEIEEAGSRNLRLFANFAGFEIVRDFGGQFPRVGLDLLGQNHGGIGLVIAETGVGGRGNLAPFRRQSARDQSRVQPLGQDGLRRGTHSARTAAAGENLQDGLRIGGGCEFFAD